MVPVVMGITSPISGTLSDRFGTRSIAVLGLVTLLIGYFSLSQLSLETSTLEYVIRYVPIGLGMGIFQSPNNSTIMGSAPKGRLGIVSGMLAINRTIGQTTGIAILGAFWASRVTLYNQGSVLVSATEADPIYQVRGLNNTFLLISLIILIALGVSIWGLLIERKKVCIAKEMHS